MKNLCTRTVICILFFFSTNIINAQVNTQDSIALVNLYNSTRGPFWKRNDNWLSTFKPLSTWYGITVTNNRVTGLSLDSNLLQGILPPVLGNITALDSLSLAGNMLSGSISSSFGNLTQLVLFDLSSNKLNGTFPSTLNALSNLTYLNLSNNFLSGSIPDLFDSLLSLQFLNLSLNELQGSIPASLSALLNLKNLDLSLNQLNGNIPSALSNLSKLTDLILAGNNFTGNIPSSLGNLTALQNLDLSENILSGNIPTSFGDLSNLRRLLLSENEFSSEIPVSLNGLANLRVLDLYYNQLSGNIPSLSNLTNLDSLFLNNNELTGNIPSSLGNLTNLHALDLSYNKLSGTIPSLQNLSNLAYLNLSNNEFTFSGMEGIAETFSFATYAPQANILLHKNADTLSVSAGGTLSNNTFHWYKNGTLDTTITGDSVFTVTDIGQYSVAVTNSIATALTLYSDTADISVLPVHFISLTGSLINNNPVLKWQTVQERNSSHFNILRSLDAVNFYKIGEVKSVGNSSNVIDYTYTDASAIKLNALKIFYRLEEADIDGKTQLSNTISIDIIKTAIVLYPNPASNFIYLNLPEDFLNNSSFIVFDGSGKIVLQQKVASGSHQQINISNLSQGIYNLLILQDNKKLMTQSFIKQR